MPSAWLFKRVFRAALATFRASLHVRTIKYAPLSCLPCKIFPRPPTRSDPTISARTIFFIQADSEEGEVVGGSPRVIWWASLIKSPRVRVYLAREICHFIRRDSLKFINRTLRLLSRSARNQRGGCAARLLALRLILQWARSYIIRKSRPFFLPARGE